MMIERIPTSSGGEFEEKATPRAAAIFGSKAAGAFSARLS
jgi:hypothetical protein